MQESYNGIENGIAIPILVEQRKNGRFISHDGGKTWSKLKVTTND